MLIISGQKIQRNGHGAPQDLRLTSSDPEVDQGLVLMPKNRKA